MNFRLLSASLLELVIALAVVEGGIGCTSESTVSDGGSGEGEVEGDAGIAPSDAGFASDGGDTGQSTDDGGTADAGDGGDASDAVTSNAGSYLSCLAYTTVLPACADLEPASEPTPEALAYCAPYADEGEVFTAYWTCMSGLGCEFTEGIYSLADPESCSGPVPAPICGNGVRELFEDCDVPGDDECPAGCQIPFLCENGTSIGSSLACNVDDDCGDNSDEHPLNADCPEPRPTFECLDGTRIPLEAICNLFEDCPDASDESPSLINCEPE